MTQVWTAAMSGSKTLYMVRLNEDVTSHLTHSRVLVCGAVW